LQLRGGQIVLQLRDLLPRLLEVLARRLLLI